MLSHCGPRPQAPKRKCTDSDSLALHEVVAISPPCFELIDESEFHSAGYSPNFTHPVIIILRLTADKKDPQTENKLLLAVPLPLGREGAPVSFKMKFEILKVMT
jgi:hypothetical protein